MAPSRGAIVALVLLCFAAGAAVGALVEHRLACRECRDAVWSRAGRTWSDDQVERWSRALDLDERQREALARAVAEVKPRYDAIYAGVRERRREVDREFQERLRGLLDERQRARLDALLAREERRRAEYYGPSSVAIPSR